MMELCGAIIFYCGSRKSDTGFNQGNGACLSAR